jgi:hypothetical protein
MKEEEPEENIIVNVKLPNKRAYEIAWAICKLKGYQNLDEFVSDVFLDRIEMHPDGRAGPLEDDIDWGFKTRDEMEKEREELHKHKTKEDEIDNKK